MQELSGAGNRAKRVKLAMERVQSYVKAGKVAVVRSALGERNISPSTLRNWLKDPEKAETAYRWTEFVEVVGRLPDLEREKRNNAYDFALTELGITRDSQREMTQYDGTYSIFHDFPSIDLKFLAIKAEVDPIVATFVFKYRNRDNRRALCDGLIVTRHGRIVFAGFSRTTIFQAVFRCVAYPESEAIFGMGFIEDLNTHEIHFSRISMLRNEKILERSRAEAEEYVRESCFSL